MTVIKTSVTKVDGLKLGHGAITAFFPEDNHSSHATYVRDGQTFGITYECGSAHPYLRISPSWQMPPFARDARAWKKFCYGLDDDRCLQIAMDPNDGEIVYRYSAGALEELDEIADAIDSSLDMLMGAYPKILGFVTEKARASDLELRS